MSPATIVRRKNQLEQIENGVENRIVDISDGIISQPIGNLRKLVEKNTEEVANVGKLPEENSVEL